MSASAEVYISMDFIGKVEQDNMDKAEQIIEEAISYYGMPIDGDRYKVGRYHSGNIYESKSYGCSYEVFENTPWQNLVSQVYAIDQNISLSVSVYNLDREPEVYYTTDIYEMNSMDELKAQQA